MKRDNITLPTTSLRILDIPFEEEITGNAVNSILKGAQGTYTVKPGDTLLNIAAQYSRNPSCFSNIVATNNISNPNLIYPKQVLTIPNNCFIGYGIPKPAVYGGPTPAT